MAKATIDLDEARDLLAAAEAVSTALLELDDQVSDNSFFKITGRTLAVSAGLERDDWSDALIAALVVLQDDNDIQFSIEVRNGIAHAVYVRWVNNPSQAGPFVGLCEPMRAEDVQALCAMVQDGVNGMSSLTGIPTNNIQQWLKTGVKTRPDSAALLLERVVGPYAVAHCQLESDPSTIEAFANEQGRLVGERRRRVNAMRKAVEEAGPLPPTPPPPPPPKVESKQEIEAVTVSTPNTLCAKCGNQKGDDGRRLCFNCEDELMRASGIGTVEPIAEEKWRSKVEMLVAKRLSARGVAEEDACLLAEDMHRVESRLARSSLEWTDMGVYVEGVNLDSFEEQIREDYAGRAVQANARRNDGMVLVGGMEMNPLRLREIHDQIDGTVREIDSMILRPLLEDAVASDTLRRALGRGGLKSIKLLQARITRLAALVAEMGVELVEEDPFDGLDKE